MLLKSQIGSGVLRRSTDFIHYYQIDDENGRRHDAIDHSRVDHIDEFTYIRLHTTDSFDSTCNYERHQRQTHDYSLRSDACTPYVCLLNKLYRCSLACYIHPVSEKNVPTCFFCSVFVKYEPISIKVVRLVQDESLNKTVQKVPMHFN